MKSCCPDSADWNFSDREMEFVNHQDQSTFLHVPVNVRATLHHISGVVSPPPSHAEKDKEGAKWKKRRKRKEQKQKRFTAFRETL